MNYSRVLQAALLGGAMLGVTPVIATGTGTLPAAGTYSPVGGITGFGTVGSSNFTGAFGSATAATASPAAAASPFAPGFSASGLVPPAFATPGSFAISTSTAPLLAPASTAGQTAFTGSHAVVPTGVTPYQAPIAATPATAAPSFAGSSVGSAASATPSTNPVTSVTSMSNADLARASMGGVAVTGPAPGAVNPALSNGAAQQGMGRQQP